MIHFQAMVYTEPDFSTEERFDGMDGREIPR